LDVQGKGQESGSWREIGKGRGIWEYGMGMALKEGRYLGLSRGLRDEKRN